MAKKNRCRSDEDRKEKKDGEDAREKKKEEEEEEEEERKEARTLYDEQTGEEERGQVRVLPCIAMLGVEPALGIHATGAAYIERWGAWLGERERVATRCHPHFFLPFPVLVTRLSSPLRVPSLVSVVGS